MLQLVVALLGFAGVLLIFGHDLDGRALVVVEARLVIERTRQVLIELGELGLGGHACFA